MNSNNGSGYRYLEIISGIGSSKPVILNRVFTGEGNGFVSAGNNGRLKVVEMESKNGEDTKGDENASAGEFQQAVQPVVPWFWF